ncbi:MAG: hypothetical protein CFH41_02690 [Alphaproteobacteria bacterium MarineAlpha11_Bin1]|nr:MAG: hypothetical protein CFH41_02690 [Alphaproteobacteria bacterium MarineAlpha11_Bin1]
MKIGRIIGWIFIVLALILAGYQFLFAPTDEGSSIVVLGELWFRLDQILGTGSLNVTQAFIQRYVSVWLWESAIQNILSSPAGLVLGIPGMGLLWLFRNRPRRLRR